MNKHSAIINSFRMILLIFSISHLACKKSSGDDNKIAELSFEYKGTNYVLTNSSSNTEWTVTSGGLSIYRPDIFNGIIHFPYSGCAYLDPTPGRSLTISTNCQIKNNNAPIDSSVVYIYKSGSYTITYENCFTKSGYDIFTGSNYSYQVCDAKGTFNLTLVNNENKTISITNGKFEQYKVKR